jgi:hypothetical protein
MHFFGIMTCLSIICRKQVSTTYLDALTSPETPRRSKVNQDGDHKPAVNAADQASNPFVIPFDYRTTQRATLVVYEAPNSPDPVAAPAMLSHAEILPHSRFLG